MKKIISLLLAVVMVCGLCAVAAAADDVTEVTLKVWAPQEDQANADSWLQLKNYIELMRIRYTDAVNISVESPGNLPEQLSIPPLLLMFTCTPTTSWVTCCLHRHLPSWAAPSWSR